MKAYSYQERFALNAICPYFTMFPVEFPLKVLTKHPDARVVLDPFCGRGTTLFAARRRRVRGFGIDVSPVAIAISQAKLADVNTRRVVALAHELLERSPEPQVPTGRFWKLAFHRDTLRDICSLRASLLRMRKLDDDAVVLRAAVLGCLHGPLTSTKSYLSNQMPRTFAPKPNYAVGFWTSRKLVAPRVDLLDAIKRKLTRIEIGSSYLPKARLHDVIVGDGTNPDTFKLVPRRVDIVITSPPYYGMRTYIPDQWLRGWFLGGPDEVDYSATEAVPSSSPADFVEALGDTWTNVAGTARNLLHLYVRFGAIPSRSVDPRSLLLESIRSSDVSWKIISIRKAADATAGKRQVKQMRAHGAAIEEIDLHAVTC